MNLALAEIAAVRERKLTIEQRNALRAFRGGVEPIYPLKKMAKGALRRLMFDLRDQGLLRPASRGGRHALSPLGEAVRLILADTAPA